MKVSGAWIEDPESQQLCAVLQAGGHQALFVGGCVRDALLGMTVRDVDIATDARPDRVTELAEAAGLRVVPTGAAHGTVTVISGHTHHEVTTFRRDVATDGRRAVVAFADDVVTDAARRDFTMNALYARPDGSVIDPLGGGLADLAARRVRFVGTPAERIAEDYLRILRFFRFQAWFGDPERGIDPDGLAACAALQDGLERLSRERVGAEMRRLLAAPDPAMALAAMEGSGILGRILPGATATAVAVLVHLERSEGVGLRWMRRLAALGGDWDGRAALRLSNSETRALERLRAGIAECTSAEESGYRHGIAAGTDMLLVRAALTGTALPDAWQDALARGAAAEFPLRASDLMPALKGPRVGAALRAAERRWIDSGFRLSREDLLA